MTLKRVSAMVLLILVSSCAHEVKTVMETTVVIHDRGRQTELHGEGAEAISEVVVEQLASNDGAVANVPSASEILSLRRTEVALEVHFREQRVRVSSRGQEIQFQHLFVPLTGDNTGRNGQNTKIWFGRTYLGWSLWWVNPPDDNGVQYISSPHIKIGGRQRLIDELQKLGITVE
jgi:hypothetical protein